jgi:hypothetical protein
MIHVTFQIMFVNQELDLFIRFSRAFTQHRAIAPSLLPG